MWLTYLQRIFQKKIGTKCKVFKISRIWSAGMKIIPDIKDSSILKVTN